MARRRLPLLPGPLRWGLVVLVAGGIAAASVVRPDGRGPALGPLGLVGMDVWLHAAGYLCLALVLGYALVDSPLERTIGTVFAAAVGYGFLLEIIQFQLAYRTFSLLDVVVNGMGATFAAVLWWVVLTSDRISVPRDRDADHPPSRP